MANRLLENLSIRELESLTGNRTLEAASSALAVYPDPFQSTALPKTQDFSGATALIKFYDPYSATSHLRGTST